MRSRAVLGREVLAVYWTGGLFGLQVRHEALRGPATSSLAGTNYTAVAVSVLNDQEYR